MNAHLLPMKVRAGHVQAGIVLPIVLVFLVIMTLLGITVIRNVTLEEKMAGNSRYQQLAFQVGEAALRSCESDILSQPDPAGQEVRKCDGVTLINSNGKFFDKQACLPMDSAPVSGLTSGNWNDNAFRKYVNPPAGQISGDPFTARCMVERLQPTTPSQGGKKGEGVPYCPFRVTARVDDIGGAGTAVLLQSYIIAPLNSGRSCPIDK
jgi:Tfp pilus assembly protein PilX